VKEVYNSKLGSWSGNFLIPVATNDLNPGLYLINVWFNDKVHTLKLVKTE
jgi:hypothetical protein